MSNATHQWGLSRRQVIALAGLGPLSVEAQPQPTRVALIIGNAAYAAAPLRNPTNDARVMAATLASMGFQLVEVRDGSKTQMQQAIARARDLLKDGNGIGLLYYAGHGMQLDWRNYLLPVDAAPRSAANVQHQAVDIQLVLDAFRSARNRINIVVLDACRDNPFGASASGRGLAPLDAPPGTFLAYATAPGNVAADGSEAGGNGLYTGFLVTELQQPGARIEDIFKRVRLKVRQASAGRQVPWESTSLEEDFVFVSGQRAPAVVGSDRERDFEIEQAEWDKIKTSLRAQDFFDFLQRYPSGRISELAQFRLDQLAQPAVQATTVGGVPVLPSGQARYRLGDTWVNENRNHLTREILQRRGTVTAIDGERVIINGGVTVLTQMGTVVVNWSGTKKPGILGAPADIQIGKRWRSAFTNERDGHVSQVFYEHRVAALEEIDVPAGRFTAFRIEATGESTTVGGGGRRLVSTLWLAPATMLPLRVDTRQRSLDSDKLLVSFDVLLVSRQLVPRT